MNREAKIAELMLELSKTAAIWSERLELAPLEKIAAVNEWSSRYVARVVDQLRAPDGHLPPVGAELPPSVEPPADADNE